MTRKEAERQEAIEKLRGILKPGDMVYTILRHVSRSGMSRDISVLSSAEQDITWLVGRVLDYRRADNGGLRVGGCGMDMGFHIVHNLSYALFPGSFVCIGPWCPANDHSNGGRDYTPHLHSKGAAGYALKHRWL